MADADPPALAKDLKIPIATLVAAFERLLATRQVVQIPLTKSTHGYLWLSSSGATG